MSKLLSQLIKEETLKDINTSDVSDVTALKETVKTDIITPIVDFALPIIFFLIIAYGIYGGILYITSYGSDEKAASGKKTMTYSIIGAVIVAIAWLVVKYIASLTLEGGNTGAIE